MVNLYPWGIHPALIQEANCRPLDLLHDLFPAYLSRLYRYIFIFFDSKNEGNIHHQTMEGEYITRDLYPIIAQYFLDSKQADIRSIIAFSMINRAAHVSVAHILMQDIKKNAKKSINKGYTERDDGSLIYYNVFTLSWNDLGIWFRNEGTRLTVSAEIWGKALRGATITYLGGCEHARWEAFMKREGEKIPIIVFCNKLMAMYME